MWWVELLNSIVALLESGAGGGGGAYESIATVTLASDTATVTFSSIPSTYASLQIRAIAKTDATANRFVSLSRYRFNSDTGTNYARHKLSGDGSTAAASASSTSGQISNFDTNAFGASDNSVFAAAIIDIHDYASTTKYKTVRTFSGVNQNSATTSEQNISIESGLWMSTSAINRMDITSGGGNWKTGTIFSLYGIKGA